MFSMAWVTCPACGFTQIPAIQCLKCRARLDRAAKPEPAPLPPPVAAHTQGRPSHLPTLPPRPLLALGAAALVLVGGLVIWASRSKAPAVRAAPAAAATPEPWALDLTGLWKGQVATVLPGSPPRPALREISVETDRAGAIVAAGVTLTDPGHGGAGAGYLTVPDGRRRVREMAEALAAAPRGAAVALDFIPFAPWVPRRERLWRAIEGQRRNPDEASYLLLESLETDYLIQAGVNASGFLSYAFLSPEYASPRGVDALSKIIHPDPDSALRGFRNLVWDLSGAADFVTLQVNASISQPGGRPDRIVLRRGK
jgi:hypothetical protein